MKFNKKFLGMILIFIWIGIIFYFSNSDASVSTEQTKFVIDKLQELANHSVFLKMIITKLTETHSLVYSVRKLAHLTIFCILQLLVFWVIYIKEKNIIKATIFSLIIVILYASFDEIHQYFIPGRSCQIKDVFIDTIGGCVGLTVSYIILCLNKCKSVLVKKIFNN